MGDLSKHFNRYEFSCRDGCGFDTVDINLLRMLEKIRREFDEPVVITSACRCPDHNKAVGGGDRSQHLLGRAADITVRNVAPSEVAKFARSINPDGGVGEYMAFVHIDSRCGCARWEGDY